MRTSSKLNDTPRSDGHQYLNLLKHNGPRKIQTHPIKWSLSGIDRSFLLGINPSNQILDKDTSAWLPLEGIDIDQHQGDQSGTKEEDPLIEDST
jgi:hypothetical protein